VRIINNIHTIFAVDTDAFELSNYNVYGSSKRLPEAIGAIDVYIRVEKEGVTKCHHICSRGREEAGVFWGGDS
jgi:hypothetical protein